MLKLGRKTSTLGQEPWIALAATHDLFSLSVRSEMHSSCVCTWLVLKHWDWVPAAAGGSLCQFAEAELAAEMGSAE